jgi:polar amino acid transport system substrate-binding protein
MTLRKPLAATAVGALGATALAFAMAAGSSRAATVAASCAKGSLALVHSGQVTVATDSPAYPPYFENNKPANGKGFESAVAYAIAGKLGFPASKVKWTVEPFDSSYAPGSKSFDFDINEISITAARK